MQTAETHLRENFDHMVNRVACVESDCTILIGEECAMTRHELEVIFAKDSIAQQLYDGSRWTDLGSIRGQLTQLTFRVVRRDYVIDLRELIADCALKGYYPATSSQMVTFVRRFGITDSRPWLVAPGKCTTLRDTQKTNDCVAFTARKDNRYAIGLRAIEIPFKPDYDFLFVGR